ncbi:MAG: 50S ribosomal protein L25 [bacterium]|nr:50S ribosomal protein L25 [bacterium]
MNRLELDVSVREGTGKGPARRLRSSGQVPAVLYGSDTAPVSLKIALRDLERVLQGGANSLIDLKGADQAKGKLALVKELQRDPVRRTPIHCDLLAVDTKKRLHVSVPIHLIGRAIGVEMGGVLEPLMRDVEIICLPLEIPDFFELDVSELDVGDSLHVSDLASSDVYEVVPDSSNTVVHVIAPRIEEEETPEGEEEEDAAADGEGAAPATPAEGGGDAGGDS